MEQIVPHREIFDFVFKLAKAAAMCPEHRLEALGDISWDQYFDSPHKSEAYRRYLHRFPEYYIAAKGNANAKSMCMMIEKSLFLPLIHPFASQHSSHDVFNAPSSEAFIDPWAEYLKKLGVKLALNAAVKSFHFSNEQVKNFTLNRDGAEQLIEADIYVFAIPVEVMANLCKVSQLGDAVPALANLDKLHTELSSGIQYFCKNPDISVFPRGWVGFLDSPWAILGVYQSKLIWPEYQFKAPVQGVLSLAWSNFDAPGVLYGKPAKDCTEHEIKEEILAQMRLHKGAEFIDQLQVCGWHIDPELMFSERTGKVIGHNAPLFIQKPGSHRYQPRAYTEAPNLFVAADYVKTTYDTATMESANEAGRRAANAILQKESFAGKLCFVRKDLRTGFGALQLLDKLFYKLYRHWR